MLKHIPKVFKDFAPKKSNLTYVFLKSPEEKVGPHVSKTSVGLGGYKGGGGGAQWANTGCEVSITSSPVLKPTKSSQTLPPPTNNAPPPTIKLPPSQQKKKRKKIMSIIACSPLFWIYLGF